MILTWSLGSFVAKQITPSINPATKQLLLSYQAALQTGTKKSYTYKGKTTASHNLFATRLKLKIQRLTYSLNIFLLLLNRYPDNIDT